MGRRFRKDILYAPFCQFPRRLVLFSYNQDVGARTLMSPLELPVGVITAMLGGPFFLWLLTRAR